MKQKRNYGWKPDLPDHRDYRFKPKAIKFPAMVDMIPNCPEIYDQLNLGSCTGNAIGGELEFMQIAQGEKAFTPSRLFIYYNERVMENSVSEDAGAMIRDGIKSVAKKGVCPETMWPYIIEKFADKPSTKCYTQAKKFKALKYERLSNNITDMKSCLAGGKPFVFGFSVYESFESDTVAKTGMMPMPKKTEQLLGGHAVMCVGYKTIKKKLYFIVRNSWGSSWGDRGYFYMPAAYISDSNLCDDFWTISLVS